MDFSERQAADVVVMMSLSVSDEEEESGTTRQLAVYSRDERLREDVSLSQTHSFRVEGPPNRETSRFFENAIGRFLREIFKAEKQLLSCDCDYINKTCSVNRTLVSHIDVV